MPRKNTKEEAKGFRVVILAAGKGTRMKSSLPKVLHQICGRSLLGHVLNACALAGATKFFPVLGYGKEEVLEEIKKYENLGISFESVEQKKLLGTGDAARTVMPFLEGDDSLVVILNGDGPMISAQTLQLLVEQHKKNKANLTVAVAELENPTGYGRAVLSGKTIKKIVEEKEANSKEKKITSVNAGVYVADYSFLLNFLPKLKASKVTGEFYLPDLVALGAGKKKKIFPVVIPKEELLGINDHEQLAEVAAIMRKRILKAWQQQGIRIDDPANTYIDAGVILAEGVSIEPNVHIYGDSRIGRGTHIEAFSYLKNSIVEETVVIKANTYMEEAHVGKNTSVGPFARLRPGTKLGKNVKIGNFVEIKKSQIGDESKISHLSYLGDAIVGKNVNIGCGFITCNYDGVNKHITEIGNNAFIGSDVQAIAPIHIGDDTYVASGTTLTKNVNKGALAIARQKQENKEAYAERLRARMLAAAKNKKKESL